MKFSCCAWDSNPGREEGRCRRIHWARAAATSNNFSFFRGGRHSSMVWSAPNILQPWAQIPSTLSRLFSICIEIVTRKERNKRKEAGIGPFLKFFIFPEKVWQHWMSQSESFWKVSPTRYWSNRFRCQSLTNSLSVSFVYFIKPCRY